MKTHSAKFCTYRQSLAKREDASFMDENSTAEPNSEYYMSSARRWRPISEYTLGFFLLSLALTYRPPKIHIINCSRVTGTFLLKKKDMTEYTLRRSNYYRTSQKYRLLRDKHFAQKYLHVFLRVFFFYS